MCIRDSPTSDEVIIDWENVNELPQSISIFDVDGKILNRIEGNTLSNNQTTIAMGNYPTGLYLIKIEFKNEVIYQKLTLVK